MTLTGKRVVVTGVIPGHSRQTAEAALIDAGAIVQKTVGKTTDLLVTGARVGKSKTDKAAALGVEVVTWETAFGPSPKAEKVEKVTVKVGGQTYTGAPEILDVPFSPRTVAPMLAKAGELPTGARWTYEIKWDGYRGIAHLDGAGNVKLQSRSAKTDYTDTYPEVVADLRNLCECVLDGELVVLDEDGHSSFQNAGVGSYVVFDLLEVLGTDVRNRPLVERRELLATLLRDAGLRHVSMSPVFPDGEGLLEWAAERKLEGIVAKQADSRYREGSRAGEWVKIKLRCEQEFAVIGWKPGEGARAGTVGSLLLAVRDGGRWTFVGRVGSGGDWNQWASFTSLAKASVGVQQTFDLGLAAAAELRDVTWVHPARAPVVEVRFQRWTEDGRLWHPSIVGVRRDKEATDCVREKVTA